MYKSKLILIHAKNFDNILCERNTLQKEKLKLLKSTSISKKRTSLLNYINEYSYIVVPEEAIVANALVNNDSSCYLDNNIYNKNSIEEEIIIQPSPHQEHKLNDSHCNASSSNKSDLKHPNDLLTQLDLAKNKIQRLQSKLHF